MFEKTDLAGMRIAILATNGFEEPELVEPRRALKQAGAQTQIISIEKKPIYGMHHHDKSSFVDVDLSLKEADAADFDAVLLPGGALNADALRVEQMAQKFVTDINNAKKPVAFICHAPWLLISAKLVHLRKLTSYHTIKDDIINAGGQWEDLEVLVDNNWVSSRKPDDIPAFNREMLKLFGDYMRGKRDTMRREVA